MKIENATAEVEVKKIEKVDVVNLQMTRAEFAFIQDVLFCARPQLPGGAERMAAAGRAYGLFANHQRTDVESNPWWYKYKTAEFDKLFV